MKIKQDSSEVEALAQAIFRALHDMDTECPTGLCDYISCTHYSGKQYEKAIHWGVTEALNTQWRVEQRERGYPDGRGRCDRRLQMADGSQLWLEMKLIWLTWFYGSIQHNKPFFYEGYLHGDHHSHSVAGDLTKLERIGLDSGRYAALLLIGFDGGDGKMAADVDALAKREKLAERGWQILSDSWTTSQSAECWNRCWFAWREAR